MYERPSVLYEVTRDKRHQNVFSHKYSPQEIENSHVEIFAQRINKTAPTFNNNSVCIDQGYHEYGTKYFKKKYLTKKISIYLPFITRANIKRHMLTTTVNPSDFHEV